MKLICLNVALFEENNEKLKAFIKEQNADFLALQEVTKQISEKVNKNFISKDTIDNVTLSLGYDFFAPTSAFKNFEFRNFHGKEFFKYEFGGFLEFGNYIKSKYPILKGQNVFVQNHFTLATNWTNWPDDNCKGVEIADIQIDNNRLRIINYHGIWSKDKKDSPLTIKAAETIKKLAQEVEYPIIICGDFNLFPDTKSMQILSDNFASLTDKYNIKTTRPSSNELSSLKRNIVDYIFVSKDIKVNNFEVLNSDVSDHLPLILDFEM